MATREEWEKLMPGENIPDVVIKYVMTPEETKKTITKEEIKRMQKWANE